MSLIPAGLLASLPASLWPHTVTIKETGIEPTEDNQDSGTYGVVVGPLDCRFIPIKSGSAQMMDLYPGATHRIQLKGHYPTIKPSQFAFGDEGDGVQRRYDIQATTTDGQRTITTLVVERQGVD